MAPRLRSKARWRTGQAPLDTALAESRFAAAPASLSPEEIYDQQWAITLLDLAINRLRGELADTHRPGAFEILKHCLLAQRGAIDYAQLADQLGLSEGAARVAVHRLRKRFRELFREEISQTLAEGTDLEAEVRHLSAALARR